MKKVHFLIVAICVSIGFYACNKNQLQQSGVVASKNFPGNSSMRFNTAPHVVKISKVSGIWKMLVDGADYFIEGAAISDGIPNSYWFNMYAYGGASGHANSIRVYTVDTVGNHTQNILDSAQLHGQTVTLCLYAKHPADGANYGDTAWVNGQLRGFKAMVLKFKDHPALLMWAIGNELNAGYDNQPNHLLCWNAVAQISTMIHLTDPNHPTSTILAGSIPQVLQDVSARAPYLDCIGINQYGVQIKDTHNNVTGNTVKPYYFGEFGPDGTWFSTVPKTNFGSLREKTSTQKADDYQYYYTNYIAPNRQNGCLGSYGFIWAYLPQRYVAPSAVDSQKQVPTWYGMRSLDSRAFGATEALQYGWSGTYPANRAPQIAANQIKWGTYTETSSIMISPSTKMLASITATEPDGDPMTYEWSVVREGSPIQSPTTYFTTDSKSYPSIYNQYSVPRPAGAKDTISIKAPTAKGNYRLYCFVKDDHNHIASACLPFQVQ